MEATAISCTGLSRVFGNRPAVRDLDLEVRRGSVFGFLGPNGAGKTTTVRLMLGLIRATAGNVRILGLDPMTDGEQVRARTGVLLDQVGLYDRLTAEENLELAARIARIPARSRPAQIEAALRRVELLDRRGEHVSGFSKGMRQKLGIARALMTEPELLILDEPTSGLDPVNIKMLRDLLLSLAQEGGRTIFMCTHHLDEAQRICDQVGIIQGGHLVAVGAPSTLGQQGHGPEVMIRCSQPAKVAEAARGFPAGARIVTSDPDGLMRIAVGAEADVEGVVAARAAAGAGVRHVALEQRSLEDVYLSVVEGESA